MIDASFEAFTFTYYYPVLKILNDLFEIGKNFTFIVGGDKTAPTDNLPRAFTEYTGVNIDTFNYFRINEVLVASSGITDHRGSYTHITNETSEEQIIENFNAEKSKDFLCLNNRPRFHRMALLDDLRDNNLLENNYVSRRWQYPAKQHIVQPVIAELWYQHFHSPRMIDELYKNSIYSIAVETYYEPSFIDSYPQVLIKDLTPKPWRAFLTEKVYKPIQYGHMFIPFGMPGTSKVLNKQGFENFHEEFNCSSQYDLDLDHNIRYNTFLEIIKNFDRSRVNSNTLDKIIHNYRRFYDKEQIMNHLSEFLNTYL